MKIRLIPIILIALLILTPTLVSCTSKGDAGSETVKESADASSQDGSSKRKLASVNYTASGGADKTGEFSYFLHEEDGGFVIDAIYYDAEGNRHEGSSAVEPEDMKEIAGLFEEYGYEELIGTRRKTDVGDDVAPDAPDYYFSASFSDGTSFSANSAGDGAAALRELFERLAGKIA